MGTNLRQTDSGSVAFTDDATAITKMRVGGTMHAGLTIRKFAGVTGVAATTGGAILAWQNQENSPIIIERVEIDVLTKSTGAANLSVGTAANATTSSANLIDTYAIGGTEKVVNTIDDKGTNGKGAQKVPVGQYVTFTGSATTVGLVCDVYIYYHTQ